MSMFNHCVVIVIRRRINVIFFYKNLLKMPNLLKICFYNLKIRHFFIGESMLWTARMRGDSNMWRQAQEMKLLHCEKLEEIYR